MKLIRFGSLMVLALVLALAATGCKKKPVGVTQLPGVRPAPVTGPNPSDMAGTSGIVPPANTDNVSGTPVAQGIPSNEPGSHQGWIEDRNLFKAETVHFDFDSSVVKGAEKPKVAAVADYLKGNAAAAVRIEGNCDERGTEEYNRALGERRALALREELVQRGILPTRVDTISYGEDRPANPGHNEEAWRENRRGDFVLLTPPAR